MLAGAVELEVVANAVNFNAQAGRSIRPGLRDMTVSVGKAVTDAAKDFDRLGDAAGDAFTGVGDDLLKELDVTQEFEQVARTLESEAGSLADRMENEFADLGKKGFAELGDQIKDLNRNSGIDVEVDLLGEEQLDDLRKTVQQIADTELTLDADGKPAAAEVEKLSKALKGISDATVVISGNNKEAKAKIDEVIGLTMAIDRVKPVIDLTVKDEAIKRARGLIDDLNQDANVKVNVDDAEIERIARQRFNIPADVKVDSSQLDRIRSEQIDVKAKAVVDRSEIDKLSNESIEIELDLQAAAGAAGGADFGAVVEGIASSLTESLVGALKAAGPVGKAVGVGGALLGGVFATSFAKNIEFDVANDRLAAQLGSVNGDVRLAGEIAGRVYAGAWGESLEEVNDAVRGTIGLLGGLTDENSAEVERLTALSLDLASAWGKDVNEVMIATNAILKNDLAPSGEAALDILAAGLSKSIPLGEDLLETFGEYSNQLADAGVNAEQFTQLYVKGLEAGARSTDGLADGIKEFFLEANAGAKATREGLDELGIDLADIQRLVNDGQGAEAFRLVAEAIGEVSNKTDQSRLAQELLRGTYEQVGIEGVIAMGAIEDSLGDVEGAAGRLSETINDNLQVAITEFTRGWEVALADFGGGLVDAVESGDSSELDAAANRLGEKLGVTIAQATALGIEVLPSVLGPALEASIIGTIDGLIPEENWGGQELGETIGTAINQGIQTSIRPDQLFAPLQDAISDLANGDTTEIEIDLSEVLKLPEISSGGRNFAGPLVEGLEDIEGAASDANDELFDLGNAIDRLFDFSGEQALANAADAVQNMGERFTEMSAGAVDASGNLDLFDEAGRSLLTNLGDVSEVVSDLFKGDNLDPAQIGAALDAIRASFREAAREAGFTEEQIDGLIETFINADGRVIGLGMDLDTNQFDDGLQRALAAGQGADGLVFEPGMDINSEALYVELQQAETERAAFNGNPFVTTAGVDTTEVTEKVAAATGELTAFEGLMFEPGLGADTTQFDTKLGSSRSSGALIDGETYTPTIDADPNGFDAAMAAANNKGQIFDGLTFRPIASLDPADFNRLMQGAEQRRNAFDGSNAKATITLSVFDLASAKIAAIKRGASSSVTFGVRANQRFGADGMILPRRLQDGAVLDGIQPAVPGGREGFFGNQPILISENGGDELFINSRSSDARKADLVRSFDGGSLVDVIRNQIIGQSTRLQDGGILTSTPTRNTSTASGGMDMGTLVAALDNLTNALAEQQAGGGVVNENTFVVDSRQRLDDVYALISQAVY